MRREDFTIGVDIDDRTPQLLVTVDGTAEMLRDRLGTETPLDAEEIDVVYRQTAPDESDVLSVTNRLTGEYIFEAPLSASKLQTLVDAVGQRDEEKRQYRLRINFGEESRIFEKRTLLVYDADGTLDRERSLIPGSVEL